MAHWQNVEAISKGAADESTLWQWVGGALTWSRVAEMLRHEESVAAMQAHLEAVHSVIQRYRRTGRIGFAGPDYQAAKEGALWMDALAEVVDRHRAMQAAEWSEQQIARLARQTAPEATA